jgi:hypothetical protein
MTRDQVIAVIKDPKYRLSLLKKLNAAFPSLVPHVAAHKDGGPKPVEEQPFKVDDALLSATEMVLAKPDHFFGGVGQVYQWAYLRADGAVQDHLRRTKNRRKILRNAHGSVSGRTAAAVDRTDGSEDGVHHKHNGTVWADKTPKGPSSVAQLSKEASGWCGEDHLIWKSDLEKAIRKTVKETPLRQWVWHHLYEGWASTDEWWKRPGVTMTDYVAQRMNISTYKAGVCMREAKKAAKAELYRMGYFHKAKEAEVKKAAA